MKKCIRKAALVAISIGIALLFFLYGVPVVGEHFTYLLPSSKTRVFFVGDIMLSRHVERLWEQGIYPFAHMQKQFHAYDLTVGNFEASVPKTHIPAPAFTMRFSVKQEYLKHLGDLGFDILSLANNHSADFYAEGLQHTRERCVEYGIMCPGRAASVGKENVQVVSMDDKRIGMIFLNTTFGPLVEADIETWVQYLNENSDIQIAYIHWGEEYELVHDAEQERLAHLLVDRGVDAVIGHHPHVIQDIEIYQNAPIFYSLGNFIFDQYFSQDVMEGLTVEMILTNTTTDFILRPVAIEKGLSQPYFMDEEKKRVVFARILDTMANDPRIDAISGTISIKH